jgi:hypothetical protein
MLSATTPMKNLINMRPMIQMARALSSFNAASMILGSRVLRIAWKAMG